MPALTWIPRMPIAGKVLWGGEQMALWVHGHSHTAVDQPQVVHSVHCS